MCTVVISRIGQVRDVSAFQLKPAPVQAIVSSFVAASTHMNAVESDRQQYNSAAFKTWCVAVLRSAWHAVITRTHVVPLSLYDVLRRCGLTYGGAGNPMLRHATPFSPPSWAAHREATLDRPTKGGLTCRPECFSTEHPWGEARLPPLPLPPGVTSAADRSASSSRGALHPLGLASQILL